MADTLEIISTDSVPAPHATIGNLQFSWDKSIEFQSWTKASTNLTETNI